MVELENNYDVVIVGGGPAGLECARVLSNSHFSILLIEKNKKIGPKVCAGGMGFDESFDLSSDDFLSFKKSNFYFDKQIEIKDFTKSIITISRENFGQNQLNKIKCSRNITIKTSTTVDEVLKDKLIVKVGEELKDIGFNYLIGADGANSIVRKYLKLPVRVLTTMQYIIPKKFEKMEYFYNFEKLGFGYMWIFPHLTSSYVGIGFDSNIVSVIDARKVFDEFLVSKGIKITSDLKLQSAPINYKYCGFEFGNIYLIGEAAGFVSYFTGGGIGPAIKHGRDIAKKLLDNNYEMFATKNLITYKNKEKIILENMKYFDKNYMKHIVKKMFNVDGKSKFELK